jgi:galactoside O-acetyltransferase
MSGTDTSETGKSKKTHAAVTGGGSALSRYMDVVVGKRSYRYLLYFEFCAWIGRVPGALGLFLRKVFWPRLFGACGSGGAFGEGILLRHPGRIHLGERVVLSEGCILDARNDGMDRVLVLGDDVILSNNVMVSCKSGTVSIGSHCGIGAQTVIQSTTGCPVTIGSDVVIGPRCYIVGGGNYHHERLDIPIWRQGIRPDGGVTLEDDIWLGSNVSVLGGVTMGTGSIAATGAVVTKSYPPRTICGGVPAKVIKVREEAPGTEK